MAETEWAFRTADGVVHPVSSRFMAERLAYQRDLAGVRTRPEAVVVSREVGPWLDTDDERTPPERSGAMSNERPIEVAYSHGTRVQAESEALNRALRWVKVDPFYEGAKVTQRELALMQLAMRALTEPVLTESGIAFREHG